MERSSFNLEIFPDLEFLPNIDETLYFKSSDGISFTLKLTRTQKWKAYVIDDNRVSVNGASGKWSLVMSKKQFVEHFHLNSNQKCDAEQVKKYLDYLRLPDPEPEKDIFHSLFG